MTGDPKAFSNNTLAGDSGGYDVNERLQLALDAGAIVGTWVWEVPADRFTADERFARSFGLSPTLCRTGLAIAQVTAAIHSDDQTRVSEAINEALSRGGAYRCEYRVLCHDGVYRWIEANGRVELGSDGIPQRFPGVLLDIEARHAAEAERDRLNTLLRTFTAAVPGVIYAKDRHGRMLVANRGTSELIGKPPEFYLGKTDLEFLDDKSQAAIIMATDRRVMETGLPEQVEEDVTLANGGAATWLSTKAPLRDDNGAIIGIIGSSIDVTDRKRAQETVLELNRTLELKIQKAIEEREIAHEALRQSQKMEAVGQLTGGIAHDFNNLLTGITGSLEMLNICVQQGRLGEIDRYVHAAQGAARRAAALTHRLLAFSRRQTLDPKPTDVNRLVAGMSELLQRTIGPAIALEFIAAGGLWSTLIDRGQLENALLNLCINARDAMPDGGKLTIETGNKWLDKRAARQRDLAPGQYVSACVSDTGTGMSPDVVARAFDPFFTTKPIGMGTGLGLSMVYGFARQSGGQVRIYSEMGQGTMVCLYLPHHIGDVDTVEDDYIATGVISAEHSESVLVVDDEPTVRMLIVDVLHEMGCIALEAADGVAGLKILDSDAKIDLLITDVGLPGGINGRQLADAARTKRPKLEILFVTGYAENAVLNHGHLMPGMHVLTKPFAVDDLMRRVKELIVRQA